MARITWIDAHVHVSDRSPEGTFRDRLLDDLVSVLDGADADLRLVISPDGHWLDTIRDEADGAHRANAFIHGLVEHAPGRLYGSCMVNPNFPEESIRIMETCFEEWGFVQLGEMLQYMFHFDMDCDASERIVRRAVAYDVPVQVHISTSNARVQPSSFGREQLLDLFAIAERVPEAQYILAHAVGNQADNPPVVDEYLDMVEERYGSWPDNFWMEIADFSSPGLCSALARVPARRLISGTDWTTRVGPPFLPFGSIFGIRSEDENPFPPSIQQLVGFLKQQGATDGTIARIAYRNAAELLSIAVE
jgi:predicted TIM-barrel fold metal-dependent hydrolase